MFTRTINLFYQSVTKILFDYGNANNTKYGVPLTVIGLSTWFEEILNDEYGTQKILED